MHEKRKYYTADRYSEDTKADLEIICTRLAKIEILQSDRSQNEISSSDHIYLVEEGVVIENEHDKTRSLHLGTLENFKDWCEECRKKEMKPKQGSKKSIGPIDKKIFSRIRHKATTHKADYDRREPKRKIRRC